MPYSPLGRQFLTGTITSADSLPTNDFRRSNPRFVGHALQANLALVERVRAIAERKGITAGQLALAWGSPRATVWCQTHIPLDPIVGERYADMSSIDDSTGLIVRAVSPRRLLPQRRFSVGGRKTAT